MKTKQELKEAMNEIVQFIGRLGHMAFPESDLPKYQKAIGKLVTHKVIHFNEVHGIHKGDEPLIKLTRSDNFLMAHLKGGYKYVTDIEREINPPTYLRIWNYVSNNPLLSDTIKTSIGFLLGLLAANLAS